MNKQKKVRVPSRPSATATQSPRRSARASVPTKRFTPGAPSSIVDRSNVVGVAATYSRKMVTANPSITRGVRSMRIAHRELVSGSLAGANGAFVNQLTLALNPGLAATFPWLAPQAQQWEQYKCHKLSVEYVPIAATSTQGDVILSPDYDASDPTPTTEVQAVNNAGSIQDSCWKNIKLDLDLNAMMGLGPRRYVRPCNVAGDIKTFDIGKVFVGTVNQTATTAVGKIYVDYDFEFFVPQNSPSPSTTSVSTSFFSQNAQQTITTATPTPITFDTSVFDPISFGPPDAGIFTPAAGTYKISCQASTFDNAVEACGGTMELLKNGASLTKKVKCQNDSVANASGASMNFTVFAIIPFNGTDTFQVQQTLTGAAGTLFVVAGEAQLIAELA